MVDAALTSARRDSRRLPITAAAVLALILAFAPIVSERLRPTQRTSDRQGAIDLRGQVPGAFGEWREDSGITPVLPNPQLQSVLDATYTQVLARTYVNRRNERVMLSIAYGNDQSSEATAVHRPDFCYRAQGFSIADVGLGSVPLGGSTLTVRRLLSRMDQRHEPISYWVTLDRTAALPGLSRKLAQLEHGLRGEIADGMIVRVSTLSTAPQQAFALQDRFLADLHQAIGPRWRARYFGS